MQVVFHVSSGNVDDWKHAVQNVRNLLEDETVDVDDAVLLANGGAIWLFEAGAPLSEKIRGLGSTGVRCVGCRNSVRGHDIAKSDLLSNVKLVPSGVGELTRLQSDGYAYLKVP